MAPDHRSPTSGLSVPIDDEAPIFDGQAIPSDSWWTGLTLLAICAVLTAVGVASFGGFLAETAGTVAAIVYVIGLSFVGPAVLRRWLSAPLWRWCARGASIGGIIGILSLPIVLAAQ